jgi:amino acid permease
MQTVKGILIMLGLFVLALVLMLTDPLNLNPDGINGEGFLVGLYVIPVALIGFIIYKVINRANTKI